MLQSMRLQRLGHSMDTKQQQSNDLSKPLAIKLLRNISCCIHNYFPHVLCKKPDIYDVQLLFI